MSLIEGDTIAIRNSRKVAAWGVHLFTASGVAWGFLALLAIQNHDWLLTFLWMAIAVAVDSLDGTLARRLQVKGALPGFDGALLDNVVDYLTYVVVPAFFLVEADLFPPQLATTGAVVVRAAIRDAAPAKLLVFEVEDIERAGPAVPPPPNRRRPRRSARVPRGPSRRRSGARCVVRLRWSSWSLCRCAIFIRHARRPIGT